MNTTSEVRFTAPDGGDRYGIAGGTYRILVDGAASGGAFAIIEMLVPPGGGPVPHRHPGFQETFVIAEGEVTMRTGRGSFHAPTGSTVHIPLDGPVHCFKNESDAPAKLLCTVIPAGLDAMFREAGTPLAPGEPAPAPGKPSPDMIAKMRALAAKYGQEIFPPDYLDNFNEAEQA
jgi:quercetin dioxygenase-like cupin family protein